VDDTRSRRSRASPVIEAAGKLNPDYQLLRYGSRASRRRTRSRLRGRAWLASAARRSVHGKTWSSPTSRPPLSIAPATPATRQPASSRRHRNNGRRALWIQGTAHLLRLPRAARAAASRLSGSRPGSVGPHRRSVTGLHCCRFHPIEGSTDNYPRPSQRVVTSLMTPV